MQVKEVEGEKKESVDKVRERDSCNRYTNIVYKSTNIPIIYKYTSIQVNVFLKRHRCAMILFEVHVD